MSVPLFCNEAYFASMTTDEKFYIINICTLITG